MSGDEATINCCRGITHPEIFKKCHYKRLPDLFILKKFLASEHSFQMKNIEIYVLSKYVCPHILVPFGL